MRTLARCDLDHTTQAETERQQPPQSSRTLDWFTAAPALTRALTASTWPFSLAIYSGVQPSVCKTPHTPHDDGPNLSHTITHINTACPTRAASVRHHVLHDPLMHTCTQNGTLVRCDPNHTTHAQPNTSSQHNRHAPSLDSLPRLPPPGPSQPSRDHTNWRRTVGCDHYSAKHRTHAHTPR